MILPPHTPIHTPTHTYAQNNNNFVLSPVP